MTDPRRLGLGGEKEKQREGLGRMILLRGRIRK